MNLCRIDGISFDVLVTGIRETTNIIEGANSGVSLYRQREIRDIKGTKIGHTVSFAPDTDPAAFDALYEYLFGTIRESVMIEAAHGQETINYEAAYNTCEKEVVFRDEENKFTGWDVMTVEFRPIETQIDAG